MAKQTATMTARPETTVAPSEEEEALTQLKEKEDVLNNEEILEDPVKDLVRDSLESEDDAPAAAATSEDVETTTSEDVSSTTSEDTSTATSEDPETSTDKERVFSAASRLQKALDEENQKETTTL